MKHSIFETLHIISKGPSDQQLYQNAFDSMLEGDAIVFTQAGVYSLLSKDFDFPEQLIYALSIDVDARGLSQKVDKRSTLISDAQFVALCCQYKKTISWF
ncbi:MAG: sulfurtransferase complex subunit TusB [Oceanospirillaceae bacterium]|nr:sulfurtransferase complex subunit TusB [Oceanospirillaceae bacterium]